VAAKLLQLQKFEVRMLNDELQVQNAASVCANFELISLFRRRVVFDQQRLDFFVADY
jgi:hypothetical protein